jgi:hypothetical protein
VGGEPKAEICAEAIEDHASASNVAVQQAKVDIVMLNMSLLEVEGSLNVALWSCSSLKDLQRDSGVVQNVNVRLIIVRVLHLQVDHK